jgi:hypothetical protein
VILRSVVQLLLVVLLVAAVAVLVLVLVLLMRSGCVARCTSCKCACDVAVPRLLLSPLLLLV